MSIALADLLRGFVRDFKLDTELAKTRIPRYWAQTLGERLASKTEVRSFEDGVLRIHVPEASWRSELNLRKEELRQSINRLAGSDLVRTIIIR